jgi:hypothetical protein
MSDPLVLTCTVALGCRRRRAGKPRRGGPPAPVQAAGIPRLGS